MHLYHYYEYIPNILLTPWVATYWTANGFMSNENISKILPDDCVDIIFIFDEIKGTFYAKITGTMTTFLEITYSQSVQMFGIRFKPAGWGVKNSNIHLLFFRSIFAYAISVSYASQGRLKAFYQ